MSSNVERSPAVSSSLPATVQPGTDGRPRVEIQVGSETFRLTGAAADFLSAAAADNTKRAYAGDFRHFVGWCDRESRTSMPATPEDIANYLAELATGSTGEGADGDADAATAARATATIKRRVAAIRLAHKAAGHIDPTGHVVVERTLAGIVRTLGSRQDRSQPLTKQRLAQAVRAIDDGSLRSLRDRTLLLVGFAGAFRRSELVAIRVEDVTFSEAGVLVDVPRSKTDQAGHGRVKAIPRLPGPRRLCPARSLADWCDRSGVVAGPVFRGLTRAGDVRGTALHDGEVSRIVKRAVTAIGLDPSGFSGHSLRAGFVTTARAEGVPDHLVMSQTGHTDPRSLAIYTRPEDLFVANPLSWLRWDDSPDAVPPRTPDAG
jgi:integrase